MAAPHEKYRATLPTIRLLGDAELYDLEEEIVSLVSQPGWETLEQIMGDARERVVADLINGDTKSQADYARWGGFAAGMAQWQVAVQTIREVASERRDAAAASAEVERLERQYDESERAPDGISEPT